MQIQLIMCFNNKFPFFSFIPHWDHGHFDISISDANLTANVCFQMEQLKKNFRIEVSTTMQLLNILSTTVWSFCKENFLWTLQYSFIYSTFGDLFILHLPSSCISITQKSMLYLSYQVADFHFQFEFMWSLITHDVRKSQT